MSILSYHDDISVGLPLIDDQHKELISLANGLIQAMVNGAGRKVLEDVFLELRAYFDHHFEDEERYMKDIGFPDLERHQQVHRGLAKDVEALCGRFDQLDGVTPKEVLEFINQWISGHLLTEDVKIGQFARSK